MRPVTAPELDPLSPGGLPKGWFPSAQSTNSRSFLPAGVWLSAVPLLPMRWIQSHFTGSVDLALSHSSTISVPILHSSRVTSCKSHVNNESSAVFRARKRQEAQALQNQGNGLNFQPKIVFSLILRTDVSLVLPKHTCGRTRADSFQDIAVLSGYNATAALLGQVPPGRTRCLKTKVVLLKQHIVAPNPTGVNRQECCNRKTLLDAEGTTLSLSLPHSKSQFPVLWAPLLHSLGLGCSQGGQEEDRFLVQVYLQAK